MGQESKKDIRERVNWYNNRRTPRARSIDNLKQAKNTFHLHDEWGVNLWQQHPNKYDLYGIDSPVKPFFQKGEVRSSLKNKPDKVIYKAFNEYYSTLPSKPVSKHHKPAYTKSFARELVKNKRWYK